MTDQRKGGGAMNAMTPIRSTLTEAADDVERGYRAAVSIHYPNIDATSMELRCRIMRMRDSAAGARQRCVGTAEPMLAEVARVGALAALANLSKQKLWHVEVSMAAMIEAARMMQRGKVVL